MTDRQAKLKNYKMSEVQNYVNTIDPDHILDSPIWKRIVEAIKQTQSDPTDVNRRIFKGIFTSLTAERTLKDLMDVTVSSFD